MAWALTYGPTEECCLTIDFLIQNRSEGYRDIVIDVVAVNLEDLKSDFLEMAQYPRPRDGEGGVKTQHRAMPDTLQLSTDGKRLLIELHNDAPAGETGYFAEIWVADLEWDASIPDRARYVGMDSVPFHDSFNDNRANWHTHNVAGEGHRLIRNGRYEFKMDKPSTFTFGNPGYVHRDFDCSVTAQRIGGPDDNEFGIMFRMVDNDNFYKFAISSDRYFRLDKWVDGESQSIKKWERSDAILGGERADTIRVRCVGTSISLFANGNLLAEVTGTSHSLGRIALFAGTQGNKTGVSVAFDDFSVMPMGNTKNVYFSATPMGNTENVFIPAKTDNKHGESEESQAKQDKQESPPPPSPLGNTKPMFIPAKAENKHGESKGIQAVQDQQESPPPPSRPTDLDASNDYTDKIKITWRSCGTGFEYRVFRADSKNGKKEAPAWQRSTYYMDVRAVPGKQYYYWIKCRNRYGESDYAGPVTGVRQEVSSGRPKKGWGPDM